MRLAIIDDHPSSIQGVMTFTSRMATPPVVEGYTSLEAFAAAHDGGARFNLVLLDLTMPGHSELSALEFFRSRFDEIPVVVLSANYDASTIWTALERLNAMGYIPKSSSGEVTVSAIELVLAGGVYVPPEVFHHPEARMRSPAASTRPSANGSPRQDALSSKRVLASMTMRQRDVLQLLLKGMPDKAICRELNLSQNTVKKHKTAVFGALHVDNRTKVVLAAHRLGLIVDYEDAPM